MDVTDKQGDGVDEVLEVDDAPGDVDVQVDGQYMCAYSTTENSIMTLKFPLNDLNGNLKGVVTEPDGHKRIILCSPNTPHISKAKQASHNESCLVPAYKLRSNLQGESYVRLRFGYHKAPVFFFVRQTAYEEYLVSLVPGTVVTPTVPRPLLYDKNATPVSRDPFKEVVDKYDESRRHSDEDRMNTRILEYRAYWNAAIDGQRGLGSVAARTWDLPITASSEEIKDGQSITLWLLGSDIVPTGDLVYVANLLKGIKTRRFNPKFQLTTKHEISLSNKLTLWSENLFGLYSIWIRNGDRRRLLKLQGLQETLEYAPLEYAPFPNLEVLEAIHDDLLKEAEKKKDDVPKPLPLEVHVSLDRAEEFVTETITTVNAIQTQVPRTTVKKQDSIMGASAPELGDKIWPNLIGVTDCEWAHRSAYSFGDLSQPKGTAQINRNLVLGTKSSNSLMCRYEASIRRLVTSGDSTVRLTTMIPEHPRYLEEKPIILAEYGIPEENEQVFRQAMAKNYTWFCPLLFYKVECLKSSNAHVEEVKGMQWIPMFRLRQVLAWETTLDKVVEDSCFQGRTLEDAARVPVNPDDFYKAWLNFGKEDADSDSDI